jgi:hypothetical protein
VDLPQTTLRFNTVVAAYWAERWSSHFVNVGDAGHINTDAGFGPRPYGQTFFKKMKTVVMFGSRMTWPPARMWHRGAVAARFNNFIADNDN